ncbi:hypothetical protein Rhal01_02488 [Rubritalea halochordaticola]|uniref:Endonuclease/exonuclease/phosphatase domain-containing protein n=1 Tax=Rubritalea halochordaticola TaxID=714537 RepID=A0ABP9V104_9BACT
MIRSLLRLTAWLGCLLALCSFFSPLSAKGGELKVLNWNVYYGFDGKKTLPKASQWLKEQAPDVLALQELNGITEKQLGEYAKQWGHSHAAMNKEKGFPMGLTSNQPIEVIERAAQGYHHGFLHCKTHNIHFFVVHLWPNKPQDLDRILAKVEPLIQKKERVIILGDFNADSKHDAEFIAKQGLKDFSFDYTNKVESKGFVDLVHKHSPAAKVSFPSPFIIPKWAKNLEEVKAKHCRIDFIFASQNLAQKSTSATIHINELLDKASDHYPVESRFSR